METHRLEPITEDEWLASLTQARGLRGALPPSARASLRLLDNLPKGKLLTSMGLAKAVGVSYQQAYRHIPAGMRDVYSVRVRGRAGGKPLVWGNKETIEKVKKEAR